MATDVKVPAAGESISEVYIGTWLKKPGEAVAVDEPIVEVETDKATLDIPAPVAGVLVEQLKAQGDAAAIGEVIARIDESATAEAAAPADEPKESAPAQAAPQGEAPAQPAEEKAPASAPAAPAPSAPAPSQPAVQVQSAGPEVDKPKGVEATSVMPAAARLLEESGLTAGEVPATGPGGRLNRKYPTPAAFRPLPWSSSRGLNNPSTCMAIPWTTSSAAAPRNSTSSNKSRTTNAPARP